MGHALLHHCQPILGLRGCKGATVIDDDTSRFLQRDEHDLHRRLAFDKARQKFATINGGVVMIHDNQIGVECL